MKLQGIARIISKNLTVVSIASAFLLGVLGMTGLQDKIFDTSTWFMSPAEVEEKFGEDEDTDNLPDNTGNSQQGQEITNSENGLEVNSSETKENETELSSENTSETGSSAVTSLSETSATTESQTSEQSEVSVSETSRPADESTTQEETKTSSTVKEETTTAAPEETTEPVEETTEEETTTLEETTTTTTEEITTAAAEPASLGDTSGSYDDDMAREVLDLVNEIRANNGLSPLEWNGSLAKCAKVRASELPVKWSHTRPDGSKWYTVNPDIMYGENLAKGQTSASAAVNAWMESETHRANIMADYNTLGVACYYCDGAYYWVQEFGY